MPAAEGVEGVATLLPLPSRPRSVLVATPEQADRLRRLLTSAPPPRPQAPRRAVMGSRPAWTPASWPRRIADRLDAMAEPWPAPTTEPAEAEGTGPD